MTVGWSTAGFAEVAALVRERTGLVFPEMRVRDVEATIQRTMARRGIRNVDALLARLRDDDREREAFVADLTIGESYFQRDPAQFALLRERILPGLLEARPKDRPIRVWSAGCAAGEEPYTVAMLFEELGAADRSDIIGTDIARARLQEAQRGLYSKWQLRSTPEPVRRKYFAEHGRFFELSPRIRQRVDFRYLNLAEDSFPSLTTGIWGMDVILCRNVLIYFDAPTVTRVAERLIATLSEDGWLLLGASDPAISDLVECDAVLTDAGLAYRRRGAVGALDLRSRQTDPTLADPVSSTTDGSAAHPTTADWTAAQPAESPTAQPSDSAGATEFTDPAGPDDAISAEPGPVDAVSGEATPADAVPGEASPADAASAEPSPDEAGSAGRRSTEAGSSDRDRAIEEAYGRRDFAAVQELAEAASREGTLSAGAWTVWVRALANEGRLDEAAAALDRAVQGQGATAELLYLQAVLLLQAGRPVDAAAAARRALYLDRGLVVAHLTLGEALRRTGSVEGARRALRNAETLLGGQDAGSLVPASDGERAGRLAELVRVKLRLLGGPAGNAYHE